MRFETYYKLNKKAKAEWDYDFKNREYLINPLHICSSVVCAIISMLMLMIIGILLNKDYPDLSLKILELIPSYLLLFRIVISLIVFIFVLEFGIHQYELVKFYKKHKIGRWNK